MQVRDVPLLVLRRIFRRFAQARLQGCHRVRHQVAQQLEQFAERTANKIVAKYEGRNVPFNEDFTFQYAMDASRGDALEVAAYRQGPAEPGFFEAQALLSVPAAKAPVSGAPRTVVALFDTSLSMQWEKLERSYQALDAVHRRAPSRRSRPRVQEFLGSYDGAVDRLRFGRSGQ